MGRGEGRGAWAFSPSPQRLPVELPAGEEQGARASPGFAGAQKCVGHASRVYPQSRSSQTPRNLHQRVCGYTHESPRCCGKCLIITSLPAPLPRRLKEALIGSTCRLLVVLPVHRHGSPGGWVRGYLWVQVDVGVCRVVYLQRPQGARGAHPGSFMLREGWAHSRSGV